MIQDFAGIVVLLLALLYLGRRGYAAFARKKKSGQGCSGCGCGQRKAAQEKFRVRTSQD